MPTNMPTLWLLAGLALIILVLLAYIAARRWHQARISASQYRTASGRTIDADVRRIQRQPMATRRVRAGTVSHISQAATAQALRLARFPGIEQRAINAARFDARTGCGRTPNAYPTGTPEAIIWFSWYEPNYLAALERLKQPLACVITPEDLEFFGEETAAEIWGINAVRAACNAKNGTVQTTARQPVAA